MKNRPDNTDLALFEGKLARLARGGHVGAIAALFDLYKSSVYSLCRLSTGTIADAEEMTQNIFLDVFRSLATCPGAANFSELLYRIVDSRIQLCERTAHLRASFLDHLVKLAAEPLESPRPREHASRMRARLRSEQAPC